MGGGSHQPKNGNQSFISGHATSATEESSADQSPCISSPSHVQNSAFCAQNSVFCVQHSTPHVQCTHLTTYGTATDSLCTDDLVLIHPARKKFLGPENVKRTLLPSSNSRVKVSLKTSEDDAAQQISALAQVQLSDADKPDVKQTHHEDSLDALAFELDLVLGSTPTATDHDEITFDWTDASLQSHIDTWQQLKLDSEDERMLFNKCSNDKQGLKIQHCTASSALPVKNQKKLFTLKLQRVSFLSFY